MKTLLEVGQIISAHAGAESEFDTIWKLPIGVCLRAFHVAVRIERCCYYWAVSVFCGPPCRDAGPVIIYVSDDAVSTPDRDAEIASLRAQIDAGDRVIAMLHAQLARLRRMTFGTSSEKLAREIKQLELSFEEYEVSMGAEVSADMGG